jgi:hypothetical protein
MQRGVLGLIGLTRSVVLRTYFVLFFGSLVAEAGVSADHVLEVLKLAGEAKGVVQSMLSTHEITEWYFPKDAKPVIAAIALELRNEKGTRMMNNMALTPFRERTRTVRVTVHDVQKDEMPKVSFMFKGDAAKEIGTGSIKINIGENDENRADHPVGSGESVKVHTPGKDDKAYYLAARMQGISKELFLRHNPNAWVSIEVLD